MSVKSISTALPPVYGVVSRANSQTARVGVTPDDSVTLTGTTPGRSTDETPGSPGDRSPPGIALYQRVSQYGNNESSTSALLKNWNDIVQGGHDADSAVAGFAKALSQNETLGYEAGVIDLTA
jgi:hypothetical protein